MNRDNGGDVTTRINWNGSRWAGQQPAALADLFAALASHPLGDFWQRNNNADTTFTRTDEETGKTWTVFWGNFRDVSHGFEVETDEPAIVAKFTALIKANRDVKAHPCMRDNARKDVEHCPCYASHFGRFEEETTDSVQP